ncbi:MAG: RHS repeat-associated core domain-containing protein, partial [Pseudomonadota bacterium]
FGNRLTKTDASGTISYTYDANDRLLSEAGPTSIATYTYDDNGNTLSKTEGVDTTLYSYDFENRLVGVNSAAGAIAYGYDSDGIRVAKSTGTVITRYLVDKNRDYAQVLEETDNSSLTVSYVYGDDLIAQNRGSSYYYLYDGQMSTRQLVDNSEAVLNEYTYDAFGIILGQAGVVANNYMYTGEQYDPNAGFYYLRARYYDQGSGRFVTSDPWEGHAFEPVTLHKYLYANANPVMYIDPSGQYGILTLFLSSPGARILLAKLGITSALTATTLGIIAHEAIVRDIAYYFEPFADKLSIKGAGPNAGYGFVDVYVPPNQFYEIKVSGTSAVEQINRYSTKADLQPGKNSGIKRTITDVPIYIKKFPIVRLIGIKVSYWYEAPGLLWYDVGLTQTGKALVTTSMLFPMMHTINKNKLATQEAMAYSLAMFGVF